MLWSYLINMLLNQTVGRSVSVSLLRLVCVWFPWRHLCIASVWTWCVHAFTCVGQVCIVSLLLVHPCSCSCWAMSVQVPHRLLCFIVLFLSPTDNFFTSHQRRLSPAERHLSALSSPPSIFPSPLCLFFPFHLTCLIFNSIATRPLYRI